MAMTHLEIFRATVKHEPHQEFLFCAGFTPDLERRIRDRYHLQPEAGIAEYFGMYEPAAVQPKEPEVSKPDFATYFEGVEKPEGSFINGLGVLEIPAKFYHFTGYISPLRNAKTFSELEKFPFPVAQGFDETGMKEKVAEAHQQGKVSSCWGGHMYESAWQIRGYEEFLMDTVERPEWCEYILDRLTERNLKIATAAARAGVDFLITGDDVANQRGLMFAPGVWRQLMKKRWAKVYTAARQIKPDIQIWYHSDGNVRDIIPELVEIGVTILNPLQPECLDLLEVKKRYGKLLVFDGTIGTQSTMPFGSPEEVKKVVRERKRNLGYDGALILAPTHILEPEVPLENIEAFVEACKG